MTFKVYYLDDEPHLCAIFKEFIDCDEINVSTFTEDTSPLWKDTECGTFAGGAY
ncbi:MAG: hypothetical protein ACI8O8_001777 [Oleiphilaceae bacterium]|jgi:hypothetical protein